MWGINDISDNVRRLFQPAGRVIAKTGMSPNTLTLVGFAVNIGVAWVLATGHFLLGGFLVILAGAFDLLDGALARASGKSTTFGALLDSVIDRYSEAVILFGLLVFFTYQQAPMEIILIFAIIIGSLLVSYVKARAEGLGLDCEVGIMRRTIRLLVLSLGLIISHFVPQALIVTLWILAVFTNTTAAHRLFFVWRETKKEPPQTPE